MFPSNHYISLSSPVFSSFPLSINETDSFLGTQSTEYNGSPDLDLGNVKMNGKWFCNLGGEKNTQEKTVISAIIMVIVMCFGNAEEGVLLHGESQSVFPGIWKAWAQGICVPSSVLPRWPRMPSALFCHLFNFSSLWPWPSCNSTTRPFSSTHLMIWETSALYCVPYAACHLSFHAGVVSLDLNGQHQQDSGQHNTGSCLIDDCHYRIQSPKWL